MISYFFKVFLTLLFSFIIILYYYIGFPIHLESYTGPGFLYFFFLGIAYIFYKTLSFQFGGEKLHFSILHLIGLFLLHLLIVCVFHFTALDVGVGAASLTLFFKILWFSLLPFTILFLSFGFGNQILRYFMHIHKENPYFENIVSLGFGFAVFILLLSIFGFFGFYSLLSVIGILILFLLVGYKRDLHFFRHLRDTFFTVENHNISSESLIKKINPFLLSVEFLFIVATFLLSVNLINVVRPFPIGWDDLGVYMNFARQTALAGQILPLGQMTSWQIFTGIGYLLGSTTQAFFLNTFSGILSFITIVGILSYFLPRRTTFAIPLLIGTVYLSLPMVIFHLAKDMKLDQGLLFFNMVALFIVYYIFSQDDTSIKKKLYYLAIAGFLSGFSFTIKLTSLLLISSVFGLIFFQFLGLLGFFSYIGIYISFFTKLHLWDFLNVVYPKDNPEILHQYSVLFLALGGILVGISFFRYRNNVKKFFLHFFVYAFGIIIALLPWISFNFSTFSSGDSFSVLNMVNGKNKIFIPEYEKIHSKEFLENVEIQKSMTNSGVSTNEDLGRYFGYEMGLNNYVKLPWNLTMQENQKGEFTDVSYVFLALLPIILLFLPFRNFVFTLPIYFWILFIICIHIFAPTRVLFTQIFSLFDMPFGYFFLALGFLFFILPLVYGIKKHSHFYDVFRLNMIFGLFYAFLWSISSFGIVWYGIIMFLFLAINLAIGLFYATDIHDIASHEKVIRYFGGFVVFLIVSFYFFQSSFVHGMINLKNAGAVPYKVGILNESESIFVAHPEYITILYNINIQQDKQSSFLEQYKKKTQDILDNYDGNLQLQQFLKDISSLQVLASLISEFVNSKEVNNIPLQRDLRNVLHQMYADVLTPHQDLRSSSKIYRIGTFLKYYITENNSRLYEDSLLFQFKRYFSPTGNETPNEVIGNMKKLGMDYMLVDLNAATIDDDPQKKLTQRYEDLLMALTSEKLEILSNDSACFRAGLQTYQASAKQEKDKDFYLLMAGVNYDSQLHGNTYTKSKKLFGCYKYLYELYKQGRISQDNFSFLLPLKDALDGVKIENDEQMVMFFRNLVNTGYKAVFKIKD